MLNNSKLDHPSTIVRVTRWKAVLHWISRNAALEIAIFLALAIAAYFIGRHLLDSTVPGEGDVRSHIMKIQLLQNYLANFSWPQWNHFWYHGIPEDQYYPPGFYFLGAILSFIVKNAVIAYKIMLLLTMVLNGIAIYYFSRRFLNFDSHLAIWSLVVYETSTPLLINFMYGEGPNLLGWSVTILFLAVYLSQVMENKIHRLFNMILPGIMLGTAILIHPFPVIFAAMVIVVFHIVWIIHNRHDWRIFLRSHLRYILGVVAIGALIGMYYWLPAFLTLNYSSPIYSFTKFMWTGGTIYLLAIIFLALSVTIATRYKIRNDPKLDTLTVSFCIACALGFGATSYLPFGLGSLVQEFRFAAIIIPFLGILLILSPLKYKLIHFKTSSLAIAMVTGIFLTAFVFSLNQRESFASSFSTITQMNFGSLYDILSKQFANNFPDFAVTMFPYFVVMLFLALSMRHKPLETGKSRPAFIIAGGVCLLLLTSFIPYVHTDNQINLNRLFKYVDYYEQPSYAQIMEAAKGNRVIVPMSKGYLAEGDSLVTFGQQWNVETVNGSYNQGDPKFFKFTVHLEWEERWINFQWTRENLMQESAAKYIFIRDSFGLPANASDLEIKTVNTYGQLAEINQNVSYTDKVTPVLIDVKNVREVTEFFNILLPQGYKLVLVDIKDINPDLINVFSYVMLDDASKISSYNNKTIFFLNDSLSPSVSENQGMVTLNVPYLTYTNKLFYHGDVANGYMWIGWDAWPGSKITPDIQEVIFNVSNLLIPYLNKLEYSGSNYKLTDTRINLETSPGFTLVKDSYFPYWKTPNNSIMSTSQGFMLIYADTNNVILNYQKPLYYIFAAACSVLGLILMSILLLVIVFPHRKKST